MKNNGYNVELILVKNIPQDQVHQTYRNSDIVIDQLLIGWYGLFAIEAMALYKPVLCFIRGDLLKYEPDLPIINTNPDNLYNNLKLLIENPTLRKEIGEKSHKYVEEVHDSRKIAQQLLKIYESL